MTRNRKTICNLSLAQARTMQNTNSALFRGREPIKDCDSHKQWKEKLPKNKKNSCKHGFVANKRTIEEKRGVAAPLQQCLTEGRASVGIGPPLLLAFTGFLFPCCPFLGQGLGDNASASRHFDWSPHGADGPLIHHRTIDIPALANVEKAHKFKRARIFSASSLLRREGLVPIGHSDSDTHALKAFKLSPIAGAGELLDGVIDDCHGRKAEEGVAAKRTIHEKGAEAPFDNQR
jgi:hypothetical protein